MLTPSADNIYMCALQICMYVYMTYPPIMTTVHPYIHLQTKVNAKKYNDKRNTAKGACINKTCSC